MKKLIHLLNKLKESARILLFITTISLIILSESTGYATTYYVCASGSSCGSGWSTGNDSNAGTSKGAPFKTIAGGIGKMSGGDTLIVGNGSYTGSIAGSSIPSGSAGAYTTVQAENTHGVVMTGNVTISNPYIVFRGFKINGNGANPVVMLNATNHVKVMQVAAYGAAGTGNTNVFDATSSSYILFEECWAWGTGRYKFSIYWCDHAIVRRCVSRHDYHNDSLQCANFNNYDSVYTVWQNNIAIDSSDAHCTGGHYGGFFFENKSDHADDTSQTMNGNIILNVTNATYAAGFLDRISGTHTIDNMIIWGGESGFSGEDANQTTPVAHLNNWTVGGLTGTYDGNNGEAAGGTGVELSSSFTNYLKNSILYGNHSYGIADYVTSNYNAFYGNGAAAGGAFRTPSVGSNSRITTNPLTNGLLYLPRIEAGSTLKTAGESNGQIGAQVMYKVGVSGSLYGETGWNTLTSDPLWPFPNESYIKSDMASYSGSGGSGTRGFCTTAKQLNNTDTVTLTSYIWEYLGNQIPSNIYGGGDNLVPSAPTGLQVISQ